MLVGTTISAAKDLLLIQNPMTYLGYLSILPDQILDRKIGDKVKDYYAAYITKLSQHKDGHNYNRRICQSATTRLTQLTWLGPLIIQGLNDDNVNPNILNSC